MKNKIIKLNIYVSMIILIIFYSVTCIIIYDQMKANVFQDLKDNMPIVQLIYRDSDVRELEKIDSIDRVTLINKDGKVIYDNRADIKTMPNHNVREEVIQAKESGEGFSIRNSDTLFSRNFYYAKRLNNGNVLRLSVNDNSFINIVKQLTLYLGLVMIVLVGILIIFTNYFANKLIEPLNTLNLDKPLSNDVYQELRPLLYRLQNQKLRIASQIDELRVKQKQLELISNNMNEGFFIIDAKDKILLANAKAKNLLNLKDNLTSHLNTKKIIRVLKAASSKDGNIEINNQVFHIIVNQVYDNNEYVGKALFLIDVSETIEQEKLRSEFSSNVSHELKTPLTSISGYAELIKTGIVAEDDIGNFAGKIYDEANRLLVLINDIIKLSRLETDNYLTKSTINVDNVLNNIYQQLEREINKHNQQLVMNYHNVMMEGYESLFYDIIYNLVENAIKYSGDNTKISVDVYKQNNNVIIEVEDNGIGISDEDKIRVFERFYRGDKSHSQQIEGTGLGLSIVKHSVNVFNGTIKLQTQLNKGSKFIITLPID